jgi:serine/threonine-protein kinase
MDGQTLKDEGSENDWLVAKVVGDRYYIERQLGVGGMGVVYLAQHVYMSRRCALKVLRPELLSNPEAVGRFTREAQNASRISHPNVAAVYDFGEVSGELMYLAMEYVEGDSLAAILAAEGRLSIARAVAVVAQVASALKAAHELGIVHRDLKPDNIMIARSGDAGDWVKVVDFGIARAVQQESQRVTSSGVVIGTPAYMSPEQITGDKVDARTDLYSLALVTYAMLVGNLPVNTDRANLMLRSSERPLTLKEMDPSVDWPDELQVVLNRALASDPADRQENVQRYARELVDAMRSWQPAAIASALSTLAILGADVGSAVPSEVLVTWPTPPLEQPAIGATGRPRARTRRVARLAAGGTLLAATGVAVVTWGFPDRTTPAVTTSRLDSTVAQPPLVVVPETTEAVRPPPVTTPRSTASDRRDRGVVPKGKTDPVEAPMRPAADSPPQVDSARLVTDTAVRDSTPLPVSPPPMPTTGVVVFGVRGRLAAMLSIGDQPFRVFRGVQRMELPAGDVRLRLRLDRCTDWDSTVTVRAGDTVSVGVRFPTCPP